MPSPHRNGLAPAGIGHPRVRQFRNVKANRGRNPPGSIALEGLWAIKSNDIGGMTRPLTYVKDQPAVQTPGCWFAVKMDDNKGGWTGDTRVCL